MIGAGNCTFHSRGSSLPGFLSETGFSYASFLLGAASSANLELPFVTLGIRSRSTAFYLQDNWKLTPKLMLNLGVRWDIPQPLSEVANRMSSLDPRSAQSCRRRTAGRVALSGGLRRLHGEIRFCGYLLPAVSPASRVRLRCCGKARGKGWLWNQLQPTYSRWVRFPLPGRLQRLEPNPRWKGSIFRRPGSLLGQPLSAIPTKLARHESFLAERSRHRRITHQKRRRCRMCRTGTWVFRSNCPGKPGSKPTTSETKEPGSMKESIERALNQVDPRFLSLGDVLLEDISLHPEIPLPFPGYRGIVSQALRPFPQYRSVSAHRLNNGWSNYHSGPSHGNEAKQSWPELSGGLHILEGPGNQRYNRPWRTTRTTSRIFTTGAQIMV